MRNSHTYRALWWASTPLFPLLALQGRYVRRRIPNLPEAEGARQGEVAPGGEGAEPGEGKMIELAVLGDSTAAGVGVSHQHMGLAHNIAKALALEHRRGVRWQVVGRTGATMSATRRDLAGQLAMPVDVVVISLGANDVVRLTSERRWTEGVRTLAQTLRDVGVGVVVFSSVPPVGRFAALPQPARGLLGVRARLLDALLREALEGVDGACYCEIEFPSGRQYMASDGFHPSEAGYHQWSQQLARKVAALLPPSA